ncbi:ABC transporter substrate-binding protein [Falsiroseomonas sp. HW251]|uniref:ABC transporter substrate-binding protein n=1 Tax=Falsiroseomonas sp. HW251 TaxID=3390998 RepID=UPI003D3188C0
MLRRRTLAAGVLAAIAGRAQAQSRTTVQFGILTALSGPLAAPGKFQMNGFNLAVDELNEGGGIEVGGRRLRAELKTYDTRGNPAEGSSAMQRLCSVDRVPVVLGELSSAVVPAVAPIAEENEVPFVMTVPTGPSLTKQRNRWVFRVNAHNDQLGRSIADFVVQRDWKPLAFIAWNNDAGRGGVQGIRDALPPGFPIAYTGFFNVGEVDFSAHITNIRNAGAKAVMLFMDEEPGSLAISQIRAAGLQVQLIGTLAMGSDRFLQRLDAQRLNGMVQYNAFPPNAPIPRIQAFSQRYRARFNEEAHGFAAQSYDGLMMAAAAIRAANSVEGKRVRDALARITHEGVTGTLRFDAEGQANPPVYVTEWCADGRRSILFPPDLAAACGAG